MSESMANIIGSGLDALRSWVAQCNAVGGVPIIRTKYGGRPLPNSSVIVACWGHGSEVKGGEITNIPADVLQRLSMTKDKYKLVSSL
jgi:hypothetical protein